jgi:long-subunit fatty acid transport protein
MKKSMIENSDLYVQKHYLQKGYLSAVGLSYCVDIIPQLSVGVTINFWHDGLDDNQWTYTIRDKIDGVDYSIETHVNNYRQEQYSFKGINYNLGFLMHVTPKFNIGGILKTAFSADLDQNVLVHTHEIYPDYPDYNMDDINTYSYHDSLQMPMSYGLGFQYQLSDAFYIAADWYTICWNQFLIEGNDGIAYNPISLTSEKTSTIKPVHQFRFGMEYLVKNVHQGYAIPIRWGIFYDPSPAETQPLALANPQIHLI